MDDMRDSFSKLKKKLKHGLTGSKRKPDRTEADAGGPNADGWQARPTDRAPQSESVQAGGSDNDKHRRVAGVDEREVSRRLDPDVESVVGSTRSGEAEGVHPPPSTPPAPRGGEPDGM